MTEFTAFDPDGINGSGIKDCYCTVVCPCGTCVTSRSSPSGTILEDSGTYWGDNLEEVNPGEGDKSLEVSLL